MKTCQAAPLVAAFLVMQRFILREEFGIREAAFMKGLKCSECKLSLKHPKNVFSSSLCTDNDSGFVHSKTC